MSNPCSFPAIQLLRLRRRIAETKTIPIHEQARLVKEIDEMRHDHFDNTGCSCWQDAIAESPNPVRFYPHRFGPTGVASATLIRRATR